jgi:hypothetical protein
MMNGEWRTTKENGDQRMKHENRFHGVGHCALRGGTLVGLALLTAMLSLVMAYAAPSDGRSPSEQGAPLFLPPLPLPPPLTPGEAAPTFTGGFIELRVQFPQTWPAHGTHWQRLWTAVQWLDDKNVWRDVEGWQGSLDEVIAQADGTVVGKKTWWVAEDDLDRGPFRWRIYRSQEGTLINTSETFDLPSQRHETTTVEVTLSP